MPHSIQELVNLQAMRWEEQRRIADAGDRGEPALKAQRPVIVVSRQFGARGQEIGRLAAQRLGFEFYAQELVEAIAQTAHVRAKVVESVDERIQDFLDDWIAEQFGTERFSNSEYLKNLSKVVLTLGRHGRGVIVGRGAQFILDPALTLRVRTFAPLETRVRWIAQNERLDPVDARAKVLRIDSERAAFCRQHFNEDLDDPRHYDLLLNTGTLSLDTCAELVERAFRARFG
jgi:cytidylate kinase